MAKWEKIKTAATKQAQQFVFGIGYTFPAEAILDAIAERRDVWESMDALRTLIAQRIAAWDIRCAGKLRELFPDAFPKSLRTGQLVMYLDDRGDWVVDRAA